MDSDRTGKFTCGLQCHWWRISTTGKLLHCNTLLWNDHLLGGTPFLTRLKHNISALACHLRRNKNWGSENFFFGCFFFLTRMIVKNFLLPSFIPVMLVSTTLLRFCSMLSMCLRLNKKPWPSRLTTSLGSWDANWWSQFFKAPQTKTCQNDFQVVFAVWNIRGDCRTVFPEFAIALEIFARTFELRPANMCDQRSYAVVTLNDVGK